MSSIQHTPNTVVSNDVSVESVSHISNPSSTSVADVFGLDTQLFVFQLVNFAIVFGIIWFLILKPLTKKMEERRQIIDDSLDKAKEIETQFVMSQQRYQEKIDEAKVEANTIIAAAHTSAERLSESFRAKAEQEVRLLVEQAKQNIHKERVSMQEEITKEAADMIVLTLKKIFGEHLSEEMDAAFIRSLIEK